LQKAEHYGGEMAEVYRQSFKTRAKAKIADIATSFGPLLMRA
jgi:hypothetical protein